MLDAEALRNAGMKEVNDSGRVPKALAALADGRGHP